MSGGNWDYFDRTFWYQFEDEFLEDIKKRFPKLAERLHEKIKQCVQIIHDIDWDVSGDTCIPDDKKFEKHALNVLDDKITLGEYLQTK